MKEYIVSEDYIDGIYTDEGSTFGLDMNRELIRCRDCKHRMHNKTCIKNMKRKPDDGYCDEGERK